MPNPGAPAPPPIPQSALTPYQRSAPYSPRLRQQSINLGRKKVKEFWLRHCPLLHLDRPKSAHFFGKLLAVNNAGQALAHCVDQRSLIADLIVMNLAGHKFRIDGSALLLQPPKVPDIAVTNVALAIDQRDELVGHDLVERFGQNKRISVTIGQEVVVDIQAARDA